MNLHIRKIGSFVLSINFFVLQLFSSDPITNIETNTRKKSCCNNHTQCISPIICQFYKYCERRYSKQYAGVQFSSSINMSNDIENCEINIKTRRELKALAEEISFYTARGTFVRYEFHPETESYFLPFNKNDNECWDFEVAIKVIKESQLLDSHGFLGLVSKFKADKIIMQFYQVCAQRYNQKFADMVYVPRADIDLYYPLKQELTAIAELINFSLKNGQKISPEVLANGKGTYLPFAKMKSENNECVDYEVALETIREYATYNAMIVSDLQEAFKENKNRIIT